MASPDDVPTTDRPVDRLQFTTAESKTAAESPGPSCGRCKRPIRDAYFTAGKVVLCETCQAAVAAAIVPHATAGIVLRAGLFGLGGAIVGAGLFYGVLAVTGYQIGLVAIAVGFLVGRAVQMGSRGVRGRALQVVALVLTYMGIAGGYFPDVMKQLKHLPPHGAVAGAQASGDVLLAIAIPVLITVGSLPLSLISGFIIAIGLRQAWIMNQALPRPVIHGPFKVAGG